MVHMEPLTWVSGSFTARVLVARLQDEGIDAELRGAIDSPYSFTLGEMARIDVYVPSDQAEDAALVMLAIEVDAATDLEPRPVPAPHHVLATWLVVIVVVLAAVAPVAHYVIA